MAVAKKRTTKSGGKEVVISLPPIKAPKWLQGFVDFIREQGVVGLAVGLTLGIAAKSVVDSLVANIFNPVIGFLAGGGSFGSRYMCLESSNGLCTAKLGYGQVISDLVSFIIILAIVYFVVKGLKLDKLDKVDKKEAE